MQAGAEGRKKGRLAQGSTRKNPGCRTGSARTGPAAASCRQSTPLRREGRFWGHSQSEAGSHSRANPQLGSARKRTDPTAGDSQFECLIRSMN